MVRRAGIEGGGQEEMSQEEEAGMERDLSRALIISTGVEV